MSEKYTAIVLAAGSGRRMNSGIPKQYMMLAGYPVIYYSLKAFEESPVDSVVLVAGEDDLAFCRSQIIEKYGFTKVSDIVAGGTERFLSVYNGLLACSDTDYILIHDGARPLLEVPDIVRSMKCVQTEKACALAVPVKDTIRVADVDGYAAGTPDRNTLWAMQTPQSFAYPLLTGAYREFFVQKQAGETPAITDDVQLVEYTSAHRIRLLMGSCRNIKITTPEDLRIAEMFLKSPDLTTRVRDV